MPEFDDCPDELLETILLHADIQTISRCLRVSKRFSTVISQSLALLYKIELAVDHLEHGTSENITTAERLQAVYSRRRAWRNFDFNFTHIVTVPEGKPFAYSNTEFLWFDALGSLKILQIPSRNRSIPHSIRTIPMDQDVSSVFEVTFDADQDLLALMVLDGATLLIHILSLTTGAFHPEAKLGTIRIDDAVVPLRARFHSLQDGFIVFRLDGRHRIVVYSWKSGQFILDLRHEYTLSIVILKDGYPMIIHDNPHSPLTLSILDIEMLRSGQHHRASECTLHDLEPYQICQLHFPARRIQHTASYIDTEWGTPRLWQVDNTPVPYFYGHDHLVAIALRYSLEPDQFFAFEECTMVAPLSTFASCIQKSKTTGTRVFPWEKWSSLGTSLLAIRNEHDFCDTSVSGMMAFVYQGASSGKSFRISIHDYSLVGVSRDLTSSQHDEVEASQSPTSVSYGPSIIFQDDNITSTLPARVFETEMEYGNGRSYADFGLLSAGENGICIEYPLESGEVECHIMSF